MNEVCQLTINDSIAAADAGLARYRTRPRSRAGILNLATRVAAISRGLVAVVALLVPTRARGGTFLDAVAASITSCTSNRAQVAIFHFGTIGGTTIIAFRIAVITGFRAFDTTIAAALALRLAFKADKALLNDFAIKGTPVE